MADLFLYVSKFLKPNGMSRLQFNLNKINGLQKEDRWQHVGFCFIDF